MKLSHIAAAGLIAVALGVSGCATVGTWFAGAGQSLSSATPQQANTLGSAELIFQDAAGGADIAVQSGLLTKDQLHQLDALRANIYSALVGLRAANAAGQSLNFAIFNEALAAWNQFHAANAKAFQKPGK